MRRGSTLLAAVSAVSLLISGVASAADGDGSSGTVSAAVGASSGVFGTRSVTAVTPLIGLTLAPGTSNLSGTVQIIVTEAARTGTAAWSVTASLSADLSDGGSPAATIARDKASIATAAAPTVLGGGGTSSAGAGGTLEAARTVFSNIEQNTGLNYSGTYTSSSAITLNVPNAQKTGVYTGTLLVSMSQ